MGNKIYNDGQQNLSERATKFIGTGNGNFTQIPLFFRKRRAYRIFFFAAHYIYMRMQKKKSISDSRAVPQKAFFFNEVGIKKLHSVRGLLDGEEGSERMKNEKGCLFEKKQPLCCCGGKTRTYDLWVMSPTSYHCSTPRCRCDHSRLRVQR